MITAILIDKTQIAAMKEHMENCEELDATSAIIYLASEPDEVESFDRAYHEWDQGDPPMRMRNAHVVYMGPNWVIGVGNTVEETLKLMRPVDE